MVKQSTPYRLIASLIAVATMLSACEPSEEKSQMNLDTGIIRIEIEGQRFDAPLRYMYSYGLATHGRWPTPKKEVAKVGALNLSVLLPDLRPYYPEDEARWKERGHGDKLEVLFMKFNGPKEKWGLRNEINIAHEEKFGIYVRAPDNHGLIHYTDANKEPYDAGDKYFATDRQLRISCDSVEPPDSNQKGFYSPSCNVSSNYKHYLDLEYSYALKYLPQWKEIDDKLKALFDKFAQAAASEGSGL